MSMQSKSVVLIDGSPKTKNNPSVSNYLCDLQESHFKAKDIQVFRINTRESLTKGNPQAEYEIMAKADALVLTFPLYIFCLPGVLIRYLQDYAQYLVENKPDKKKQRIYTFVNCGFPEANINEEAVRVIQSFSRQVGAMFRFGVMLGGGGLFLGALEAPFMKTAKKGLIKALEQMATDVSQEGQEPIETVSLEAKFPRRLYLFMGDQGWYQMAKKNGLKRKELYRRPYLHK